MPYLHIQSTFNCLIKIETLEKTLTKNKTYSFLTHDDQLSIVVYPIINSSSSLPFCFSFDSKTPVCQKNIDITKFPNNNYLIKLTPFYIGSPKYLGVKTKSVTFANTTHTLYYTLNTTFNIKLECESSSCDYSYQENIIDLQTKQVDNNILIYAKLQNNQGYIFCNINYQNNTYNLISLEKINLLETKNSTLFTYKTLNDISHHGIVKKFSLTSPYSQSEYITYENNNLPTIIKHKELIPFAFFDALSLNNFKLARSYMSKTLSQKLSNTHLKRFFGPFICATLPLAKEIYEGEISLIYSNKNNNLQIEKYAKNFKIILDNNNKIDNILEE